jgi:hypothetical protein
MIIMAWNVWKTVLPAAAVQPFTATQLTGAAQ